MTDLTQRHPRHHDEKYLRWVRRQPCCICGKRAPNEAAHIRAASPSHDKRPTGMGERPDDRWAVPMCRGDHREGRDSQHANNELAWWLGHGKNPFETAIAYYREFGGDGGAPKKPRKPAARKPRGQRAKMQSAGFRPGPKRKIQNRGGFR